MEHVGPKQRARTHDEGDVNRSQQRGQCIHALYVLIMHIAGQGSWEEWVRAPGEVVYVHTDVHDTRREFVGFCD